MTDKPKSPWEPFIMSALSGIMAGKDVQTLQGLEAALARFVFALLDIWAKQPESELAVTIDALLIALHNREEPAIASLGIVEREGLFMALSMLTKGRKAING